MTKETFWALQAFLIEKTYIHEHILKLEYIRVMRDCGLCAERGIGEWTGLSEIDKRTVAGRWTS